MGEYKMLCLDIDGTLLNSNHRITEKTMKAIRSLSVEKGVPVILVSARMPRGIRFLQNELGIDRPMICYSGALILDDDGPGNAVSLDKTIAASDIGRVYVEAERHAVHASLYKADDWYVEVMDEWALQESQITGCEPIQTGFPELLRRWKKAGTGANKILCMGQPDAIQRVESALKAMNETVLTIYRSKPSYLEIMAPQVTKSAAIDFLRRRWNVEQRQIVAIGDNYNDLNMIEYAGLGVAMGNAPVQVKRLADDITFSNDEDGVAAIIYKYFNVALI